LPKGIGLSFRDEDWYHSSLRGTKRSSQAQPINKVKYKQGTGIPKRSVEQVSGDVHAHIRFAKGFFYKGVKLWQDFSRK
jgi:hypothetical protein